MQRQAEQSILGLVSIIKRRLQGPSTAKDGPWSWLVCFSSFLLVLLSAGFHASFGLIFSSLIKEFESSKGKTAVVGSLMIALTYFLSPLASFLAERWGLRIVSWIGVSLVSISLLVTSYATSIEAMYASFGILAGLGASFMYMPCFVVINYYFEKRTSFATGIVSSGLPFNTIGLTPFFREILSRYGWRFLFRIMSLGVVVIGFLAGLTYVPTVEEHQEIQSRRSEGSQSQRFEKYIVLLKSSPFLLFLACTGIFGFGVNIINVHQIEYALDIGISWNQATMVPIYMGIGSAAGRIICGKLFQMQSLSTMTLFQIILALTGITSIVTPLAQNYASFTICSFLYMACDGAAVGVHPVPTAYVTGRKRFMQGWSLTVCVEALLMLLGSPVAGWIVDFTNNYADIYYITGIPFLLASAILTAIHYLPRPAYLEREQKNYFADLEMTTQQVAMLVNTREEKIYERITVL